MNAAADNTNRLSSIEAFYREYIARAEDLRAAIQRKAWDDIERYVTWREAKLGELAKLPADSEPLRAMHQEYLSRIMVLEYANIAVLREMMDSLKTLIREDHDHKLVARYAEHA